MKYIQLTNGLLAVVDNADYSKVRGITWYPSKGRNTTYAAAVINRRTVYMHRLIMDTPKRMHTHHKDDNGLNNRRKNLYVTTQKHHRSMPHKPSGFASPKYSPEALQTLRLKSRRMVTFQGKTQWVGDWAAEIGITTKCLEKRLNKLDWSLTRCLTTPGFRKPKGR